MLHFLFYFGADSDDPTMQVYLQLAKFFINDITLDRVIQVSLIHCLKSGTTTIAPTPTDPLRMVGAAAVVQGGHFV